MKLIHRTSAALAGLVLSASSQALVITPENSGNTLANSILGAGITISNVNYSGANGSSGKFTGGNSSGLEIDSGIVMSTGQATIAQGVNNSTSAGNNNGTGGNALLSSIAGSSTYNAASLSFDFQFDNSTGGDLYFKFIFGSEEYLEWVNKGFNDVFGFFVDGVNVALAPGSTDPISIDNINTTKNSNLFVDNTNATYNTQMDGFTKAMNIALKGLDGGKHTMQFAIADVGDANYDSWIFIEANSFSIEPPKNVPEPSSILLFALGLLGLAAARKRA